MFFLANSLIVPERGVLMVDILVRYPCEGWSESGVGDSTRRYWLRSKVQRSTFHSTCRPLRALAHLTLANGAENCLPRQCQLD